MNPRPELSIIVPVLNEADTINRALVRLSCQCRGSFCEFIVVDGSPDGNTIQSITVQNVKKLCGATGRGRQMNSGARLASGSILLFLHADTILPHGGVQKILETCRDEEIVGGAFDLGIDSTRFVFRITEKYVYLRSRLTKIPYGDQAIFLKKDIFDQLGGYKEIPIMEDIDLMQRIKRNGYKIRFISDPVTTSSRRWESEGIAYGTFRNLIISTLFYLGVSPSRLKKFYK